MEELHFERADLDLFTGVDGVQVRFLGHAVARQFHFQQATRQGRGVDRRVGHFQQMVNGADMVLVAVGDDNALHLLLVLDQIGEVGDDVIDPQHIVFGEHHPGIDHHDLVVVFVDHHIAAYFPQSPQGEYFQCFTFHSYSLTTKYFQKRTNRP